MSSHPRPFTAAAAMLLALVALAHLLRVLAGVEITIGQTLVPLSVSVVATFVAGGLSLMTWRESRR